MCRDRSPSPSAPTAGPAHRLVVSLAGLPAPGSLGDYRTYVAWVAPTGDASDPEVGDVANGRADLGVVELEKFVVLVTAEASGRGKEPAGRIVLRGQSPSTRLFPPDLLEFSIGRMGQGTGGGTHRHGAGGSPPDSGPARAGPRCRCHRASRCCRLRWRSDRRWRRSCLRAPAPPARPREIVRVAQGDTLRLEAGLVQRSLKGKRYTMYAFNGQYPGPLIEVVRGAEVTVQFTNRLPHPTTVHWHGIRLDHRSDGVPDLSQPVVPPGG